MNRFSLVVFIVVLQQFTLLFPLHAQGTLNDYNRAYSLSRTFTNSKIKNHVDDARWLPDGRVQ